MGHPRPSLAGHRCSVGVLAGTHRCAMMPRVASRQSANPFVGCWKVVLSMSCGGLPNKVNVISLHCLCTRLCLTTTLDSLALFCEHFVAPTASTGCWSWMFLSKNIFIPTNPVQHALHLVRNLIAPACCLLCRCSSCSPRCRSVSLSRDCSASHVDWNCCGWACDWNCCCAVCCA